jgi:uncharacterized protein (TIGR01732 family)
LIRKEVFSMGYGYGCYGYGGPVAGAYYPNNNSFVLIVVLFILLIIVGASFCK